MTKQQMLNDRLLPSEFRSTNRCRSVFNVYDTSGWGQPGHGPGPRSRRAGRPGRRAAPDGRTALRYRQPERVRGTVPPNSPADRGSQGADPARHDATPHPRIRIRRSSRHASSSHLPRCRGPRRRGKHPHPARRSAIRHWRLRHRNRKPHRRAGSLPSYRHLFEEASVLDHLGSVQHHAGAYQDALASWARTLELSRSTGNRHGEVLALDNSARTRLACGNYPAAEQNLTRTLKLYRAIGPAARQHHENALAIAAQYSAAGEQARGLEGISNCQGRAGRPS